MSLAMSGTKKGKLRCQKRGTAVPAVDLLGPQDTPSHVQIWFVFYKDRQNPV